MVKVAKIPNFKSILDVLAFMDEAIEFEFTSDNKLKVNALNKGNTVMVDISCAVEVITPTNIKIDIEDLIKLKLAETEVALENNRFSFKGSTKGSIPLIAGDIKHRSMPDLSDIWHSINVSIDDMKQIVNILAVDNDYTLSVDSNTFTIDNNVIDKLNLYHSFECAAPNCSSKFLGMFLTEIFKNYKAFTTFTLLLGDNCPMKLLMNNDDMQVSIGIAPLVEQE